MIWARGLLAFALILCSCFETFMTGQAIGAGSSQEYTQYWKLGGIPYRHDAGFYIPSACNYVVDYGKQCGGLAGACDPSSTVCQDGPYPGACCPHGYTCTPESADVYRCQADGQPSYIWGQRFPEFATGVQLHLGDQCGGTPPRNTPFVPMSGRFPNAFCPDGASCEMFNRTFWHCIPNPLSAEQLYGESPYLDIINEIRLPLDVEQCGVYRAHPGIQRPSVVSFEAPDCFLELPGGAKLKTVVDSAAAGYKGLTLLNKIAGGKHAKPSLDGYADKGWGLVNKIVDSKLSKPFTPSPAASPSRSKDMLSSVFRKRPKVNPAPAQTPTPPAPPPCGTYTEAGILSKVFDKKYTPTCPTSPLAPPMPSPAAHKPPPCGNCEKAGILSKILDKTHGATCPSSPPGPPAPLPSPSPTPNASPPSPSTPSPISPTPAPIPMPPSPTPPMIPPPSAPITPASPFPPPPPPSPTSLPFPPPPQSSNGTLPIQPPILSTAFSKPKAIFSSPRPLRIHGTILKDDYGRTVTLHGFSWSGFEIGATMVEGLMSTYGPDKSTSQIADFATIVHRQQALGFNAVRLPFRFADLNIAPAKNQTRLCTADTEDDIRSALTNPNYNPPPGAFPAQNAPIDTSESVQRTGQCNSYLPNDSTMNRFLYVIQFYIANGFYVAIDYHAGSNHIETDREVVSHCNIFQRNWLALLIAIQTLETYNDHIRGRLFLDLLDEPDAFEFAWHGLKRNTRAELETNKYLQPWSELYKDTAHLLLQQESQLLFFLQGTGQILQPGSTFGMGFGINETIYDGSENLENALTAMKIVVDIQAVKESTIVSPHIFGPQVVGWTDQNGGGVTTNTQLPYYHYYNWAYLTLKGLPGRCDYNTPIFLPTVIGEYGNVFDSPTDVAFRSDTLTDEWMHDLATFMNRLNVNETGFVYERPVGTFYWKWNGNSFPMLGLVNNDPGDEFPGTSPGGLDIQWTKIDNLTDALSNTLYPTFEEARNTGGGFGLRPWYFNA